MEWVPTHSNLADKLTRVPEKYLSQWKAQVHAEQGPTVIAAATEPEPSTSLFCLDDVGAKQSEDPAIAEVVRVIEADQEFKVPAF